MLLYWSHYHLLKLKKYWGFESSETHWTQSAPFLVFLISFCDLFFSSTDISHVPFLPSGCGNSSMSSDMYSAGYHSITNIDYSSVCISTMSARHSDCLGMTWHQMDVRQLCFPDASFDVILEKATLDAIMVEEKTPWEVSPQSASFIHQALTEVWLKIRKSSLGLNIFWIEILVLNGNYYQDQLNCPWKTPVEPPELLAFCFSGRLKAISKSFSQNFNLHIPLLHKI